jgi:hypothetical protein
MLTGTHFAYSTRPTSPSHYQGFSTSVRFSSEPANSSVSQESLSILNEWVRSIEMGFVPIGQENKTKFQNKDGTGIDIKSFSNPPGFVIDKDDTNEQLTIKYGNPSQCSLQQPYKGGDKNQDLFIQRDRYKWGGPDNQHLIDEWRVDPVSPKKLRTTVSCSSE